MTKRILIVNGALAGTTGNTFELLRRASALLMPRFELGWCNLSEEQNHEQRIEKCQAADGFLFGTGTYWDSWSSTLQGFLEQMTETEGSNLWLGKPASVLVTMHSVGGKSVLSRLQSTLNLFGLLIPPMSAMVYSELSHEAKKKAKLETETWCLSDLEIVCHNLAEAIDGGKNWKTWPVDNIDFRRVWLKDNN